MRQRKRVYSNFSQFMTVFSVYTITMYLMSLKNLLSATAVLGVFWLLLIFGGCFFVVHIARLVCFGWLYQKKGKTQTPKEEKNDEKKSETKEKAPEPKPSAEPVYYIVERKRKARQSYGEPKEIRFK